MATFDCDGEIGAGSIGLWPRFSIVQIGAALRVRTLELRGGTMIIVGIDVETTSAQRDVCEFGAVGVDLATGREVFELVSLIDPGPVEWSGFAIGVHGIRPHMVRGKPRISAVWEQFRRTVASAGMQARVFAHNAPFERSCLSRALGSKWGIELECSLRMARQSLVSPDYKLPTVCRMLGVPFRETHRAGPDARAAAHVARALVARCETPRTLR